MSIFFELVRFLTLEGFFRFMNFYDRQNKKKRYK